MAKPYDTILNTLIDAHVEDWIRYAAKEAGLPIGPVEILDTDLSANLQADRLFRVLAPEPYLLHLELASGSELGTPERYLRYNVAARALKSESVATVVLLLRPKANASDLSGLHESVLNGRPYLSFRYTVIRVWEQPMSELLSGGLGIIPLAILSNEAARDLDAGLNECDRALEAQALSGTLKKDLINAIFVLSGLRYDAEQVERMYRRLVMTLEESVSYQLILKKGEARGEARGVALGEARGEARGVARGEALGEARGLHLGALTSQREVILLLGTKRFGPPSPSVQQQLLQMEDLAHLHRLTERLLDAISWDDLLSTP